MSTPASETLTAFVNEFQKTKLVAEQCIEQLSDDELHARINPLQNCVAVIVQHMAGNMLSRWTDFLTTDGEKPDRHRESEFADRHLSRTDLLELWNRGWTALFEALQPLSDADLSRTVHIRREPHTVLRALVRQLAHYSLHVGQIQVIGKHLRGDAWKYVSIPPGGSEAFNARMGM